MSVSKQGGKQRFPNLARVCCWDRDRPQTKFIFSWFVCLKNSILVSECSEDPCLVNKMSPICTWVTMGRKTWSYSVAAFISPIRMNELKSASSLPKGWGRGETMWHWYRKWTVSGTSRFLLTVCVVDESYLCRKRIKSCIQIWVGKWQGPIFAINKLRDIGLEQQLV